MSVRLLVPDGHVGAFCATCMTDVAVAAGSLRCPNGAHDVEPSSLPRMPKAATSEAPATTPAAQSVSLPSIRQAHSWGKATDDLLVALEAEEAAAMAALEMAKDRARVARRAANAMRQIRGLVQLGGERLPTTERKAVGRPLKEGQWSRKYDRCIRCGTTEHRHVAKGLCSPCDRRARKGSIS